MASVDYSLMRRDAKRVAEWDIECIVPCHGDVIDVDGKKAWEQTYEWFLQGDPNPGFLRRGIDLFLKRVRWLFLM